MDIEREKVKDKTWNIIFLILLLFICIGLAVIYYTFKEYEKYDENSPKFKKLRQALKTIRSEKEQVKKMKEQSINTEAIAELRHQFLSNLERFSKTDEILKDITAKFKKADPGKGFPVVGWTEHRIASTFENLNIGELARLLMKFETTSPWKTKKIALNDFSYEEQTIIKTTTVEFVAYEKVKSK